MPKSIKTTVVQNPNITALIYGINMSPKSLTCPDGNNTIPIDTIMVKRIPAPKEINDISFLTSFFFLIKKIKTMAEETTDKRKEGHNAIPFLNNKKTVNNNKLKIIPVENFFIFVPIPSPFH
ncbi:hypothetical protein [Bacillus spongiae]|uniref:hypothetical protein n=1 Tax=Bacillus spongiae TaxID=2683610 RepID=UPI003014FB7C